MENYINELVIKTSPKQLYHALTTQKGLTNWWTKQIEMYPQIGGIVTFYFGKGTYVVMKITKLNPFKEVVWKCVEQNFEVSDANKTNEWVGTTVKFTINENKDNTTALTFIHTGLTPQLSSYKEWEKEWNYYLTSLCKYLEKGEGTPFKSRS